MFPLHNHSHYSALDGYGTPAEILDQLQSLGLDGCAITDHGTVAGVLPLMQAGQKAAPDLRIVAGMEAYQSCLENRGLRPENGRDAAHLILLAKNQEGYRNLLRLSDEANRTGFYYMPRVDYHLLEKYREGIIATTACLGGATVKGITKEDEETRERKLAPEDEWDFTHLDKLSRIFRDDFYVEINTYATDLQRDVNRALVQIAEGRKYPLVYANDAHYPTRDDYNAHEMLLSIQYRKQIDWHNPHHPPCLYIMSEEQVRQHLSNLPQWAVDQAIENSDVIANQCSLEAPAVRQHLPRFTPPIEVESNVGYFLDLLEDGLERVTARVPDERVEEYVDRLMYETTAILEAKLHDYFLIVADFVAWCRHKGIMVGPGRGSAGGALISYCLGITKVDPIKYGLYFERFWNPGRTKGLPDIDVDVEKAHRQDGIGYLRNKYGALRVAPIGNHIYMRPKSAIDRVASALATREDKAFYSDVDAVKKIIDSTTDAGQLAEWAAILDEVGEELLPFYEKWPELFEFAEALTGRIQTYGIHASAVVVADVDLPDELPGRSAKDDGDSNRIIVTQAEMHMVEDQGFLKMDVLGLNTLDTLNQTKKLAGLPDFDYDAIDFDAIPEGEGYWEQVDRGQTLGLFQVEDGGSARRIAKQMKPRCVEDLAAIVALNRPGPLRSGMVDRYLARRAGEEEVVYSDALLQEICRPTFGDFLFQEQVIAYFREVGYDLGEADAIRKMLGKKLVKDMEAEKPRYLERAALHMPVARAESIWEEIIGFSKYSFNKSHAVEYGVILAQTMYAKWRWPTEFILASILTVNAGQKKLQRIGQFIQEGRRIQVEVNGPDINSSQVGISKHEDGRIYFGLSDVKGVGKAAAQWVIRNRPYTSFEHFEHVLEQRTEEWAAAGEKRAARSPRQVAPANMVRALYNAGAFDGCGDRSGLDLHLKADYEAALLGVEITNPHIEVIEKNALMLSRLDSLFDIGTPDINLHVPGIITNVRKTKTRADSYRGGRDMAIVRIAWEGEEASFAVFPDIYDDYHTMLKPRVFGTFKLKTNRRGASLQKGMRLT